MKARLVDARRVTMRLEASTLELLDTAAKHLGISRTDVVRRLAYQACLLRRTSRSFRQEVQ